MSDDKLKISVDDADEFGKFIKKVIIAPMKKKITGSITIHLLNGEIRGCEVNYMSRKISELELIIGGDK